MGFSEHTDIIFELNSTGQLVAKENKTKLLVLAANNVVRPAHQENKLHAPD